VERGTEGFQHVVDFKFTGSCLGSSGGQSVKLVAAMNEVGGQSSVLNFMEIKLLKITLDRTFFRIG